MRLLLFILLLLLLLLLYTAGNAPYVNCSEAMNRRRGWSSLVVTQPSTSHHLLCVQCGLLLLLFINQNDEMT